MGTCSMLRFLRAPHLLGKVSITPYLVFGMDFSRPWALIAWSACSGIAGVASPLSLLMTALLIMRNSPFVAVISWFPVNPCGIVLSSRRVYLRLTLRRLWSFLSLRAGWTLSFGVIMTRAFILFALAISSFGVPPHPSPPLRAFGRYWQNSQQSRRCNPSGGAVGGMPFPWGLALGMQDYRMVLARFVVLVFRIPFTPFGTVLTRLWLFDKLVLTLPLFRRAMTQLWAGLISRRLSSLNDLWPCSSHSFGAFGDINVDGTFLPSARLGAIGVLARDSSGAVLGGFARPVPALGPASAVEASALLAGLEYAIARGWASVLVESDAAVLINKLHRPSPDLSLLGGLLAPSRDLLAASRGRLRVGFAPRSANSAAHTLASWACQTNDVISFNSVCPELLSRVVLDDLSSSF
ncbi:hypothetical protein GQ457_03G017450 [Hibiscus cannabinus]